jgi:predicted nuclease of predicted toxin-antitoxin system
MRVLLDECVPKAVAKELHDHQVKTMADAGWAGVKNGELLRLAAKEFDVLLTVDRNMEYQQNFSGLALAVVVIHAASNDISALRPLLGKVREIISRAESGNVVHVHG